MSQSHPWRADLHLPSHPGDGCCVEHFTPRPRKLNPLVLLSVGPAQPVPPKPRPHPTCRFCSISSYSLSSSRARSCSRMLASRCLLLHTLYSTSLTSLLARHKVLSVSSEKRCRDETSGLPSLDRDDFHSGPGHHASQTQLFPWPEPETLQDPRVSLWALTPSPILQHPHEDPCNATGPCRTLKVDLMPS